MANILMLDIGTRCGWAVADEDAPPLPMPPADTYADEPPPSLLRYDEAAAKRALRHYHHGAWTTDGWRGAYFLRFTDWLTRRVDTFDIQVLAFEASVEGWLNMAAPKIDEATGRQVRKTNPDTIRKLMGIVAHVESVAAMRGLQMKEVNPSGLTKLAAGTGRDPGKKRRKRRGRALGLSCCDNELDAIYGLSWVLHDRQAARRAREAA